MAHIDGVLYNWRMAPAPFDRHGKVAKPAGTYMRDLRAFGDGA